MGRAEMSGAWQTASLPGWGAPQSDVAPVTGIGCQHLSTAAESQGGLGWMSGSRGGGGGKGGHGLAEK